MSTRKPRPQTILLCHDCAEKVEASLLPAPKAELSRAVGLWLRRYAECHPRFEELGMLEQAKTFLGACQGTPYNGGGGHRRQMAEGEEATEVVGDDLFI